MSCRKRTGSVLSTQARFLCSDVTFEGSTHSYRRCSEDGAEIIFDFCPACGSTIKYRHSALVDQVIIPLGVIDQTELWQPSAAIYNDRRPAWLPHNEHIEWID
ncbi:GFA family protein [uncultured Umboniibacter sp.]|uniref:GFA family protein n=1 Tax=uncultured Umboniibacter sp. TaxID=1798917 RepID=UPI0026205924|nr:GFA family protein [uncultured Umboniibacter sp.]